MIRGIRAALCGVVAVAVLAGCSSSSSAPTIPQPPTKGPVLSRIVGVGDSLTAGFQSGGLLGVNTTNPLSGFPGNLVPATQENGFWSLVYQQATGTPQAAMYDPALSPLPLIGAPGLGSQLVLGI